MVTDREVALLRKLSTAPKGLPARSKFIDDLAEMERKGLITLSGARTGLFPDPEIVWTQITDAGRIAAMSAFQQDQE